MQTPQERPAVSVVVPLYNEEGSIATLYGEIEQALQDNSFEVVFVNDGSTDGSAAILDALQAQDPRVKVVHFARNFGKSEALGAGFREAQGEVIITMDADLQDDPAQIPRLMATLQQGYDLVNGWKAERKDPPSKTIPSRVFNWVTAGLTGLRLRDFNSGFKAYRRQVLESLLVYGEQHRFSPALAYWKGFRIAEIPVAHRPRRFGRSKFGAGRFLSGFLDLFTVLFLTRFRQKPLHLFGTFGLICFVAGLLISAYLTYVKLVLGEAIGTRPLLSLGVLLLVMGIQFLTMGLLGEMLSQSAARSGEARQVYQVRRQGKAQGTPLPNQRGEADHGVGEG